MQHYGLIKKDRENTILVWRADLSKLPEGKLVDHLVDIWDRSALREKGMGYLKNGEFVFAKDTNFPDVSTVFLRVRFRRNSPLRPTTDYFNLTMTRDGWWVDNESVSPVDIDMSFACVQAVILDDRIWDDDTRKRLTTWTSSVYS